jgi:eukaryotic-like serine/threonine-protein kinase
MPGDGLLDGRFRVGELLGSGGTAAVYACQDFRHLGADGRPRQVALKVLHEKYGKDTLLRDAFLCEAARLEQVKHPNVVAVLGSGMQVVAGRPLAWIALELITGPSLAEWVNERGPVPPVEAVPIMDGLLAGLGAVHAAGMVHRDISPVNVVLHGWDVNHEVTAPMVRLVDFGLAAAAGGNTVGSDILLAGSRDARAPAVVGNAGFLSPEHALGRPIGPTSDLYQAGAVLFHLLTGQPPFERATAAETLQARLIAPPPLPSVLVAGARRLDRVVVRALAREPSQRFASTAEFADALAQSVEVGGRVSPTRVLLRPLASAAPAVASLDAHAADQRAEFSAGSSLSGPMVPVAVVGISIALALWATLGMTSTSGPLVSASVATSPSATPTPTPTASPSVAMAATVPTLYGDLVSAQAALEAAGMTLGRVRRIDSAEPSGKLLKQVPDAGAVPRRNGTVDLTVASGRNRVPSVAGLSMVAAVAVLESAGFRVDGSALGSDALVGGSQPVKGTRLAVGVTVRLVAASVDVPPSATPQPSPSTSA